MGSGYPSSIVVRVNCRTLNGFCSLCCRSTEMILTATDILRILEHGYPITYFAEPRGGFVRLRNKNGACVFLDRRSGACRIYSVRPIGCRLYPLVYSVDEDRVVLDPTCPRRDQAREYLRDEAVKRLFREVIEDAIRARELLEEGL